MASNIFYQEGERKHHVSYCMDAPVEVLRRVLPTHRIIRYGGIKLPVDRLADSEGVLFERGLIINPAVAPKGTEITQTVSGIYFGDLGSELGYEREIRDAKESFRLTIGESMAMLLDGFGTHGDYLELYEMHQKEGGNKKYDQRVQRLLEIAEVAFDIKHPTVNDLRGFLK